MDIKWSHYPNEEEIDRNIRLIAFDEISGIVFGTTGNWDNAAPVKKIDTITGMLMLLAAIDESIAEAKANGADL